MADNGSTKNVGKVIEIKGVVIDAIFTDRLPQIYTALQIEIPAREEEEARVLVAEVQQHLGDDRVRAVAMDSTDGLSRGIDVIDTGDADLGAGRPGDARSRLERARRPGRQQAGGARGHRALGDPPRSAELRVAVADDGDLRDRHQGRST